MLNNEKSKKKEDKISPLFPSKKKKRKYSLGK